MTAVGALFAIEWLAAFPRQRNEARDELRRLTQPTDIAQLSEKFSDWVAAKRAGLPQHGLRVVPGIHDVDSEVWLNYEKRQDEIDRLHAKARAEYHERFRAAVVAVLGTVAEEPKDIAALEELATAFPGRLTIVEGDALALDPVALTEPPRRIAANLPYNIATPLLLAWLRQARAWDRFVLMFQKEVAERLAAAPGGKSYGRLSVITQFFCKVELVFDVAPSAFVPPPQVTSTVVRLTPLAAPRGRCDPAALERVTAAAFGQRRKMLRQSLKTLAIDPLPLLAACGIDPTARAEDLSVEQFAALATAAAS